MLGKYRLVMIYQEERIKNDFPNREHSVWSKGYDKV